MDALFGEVYWLWSSAQEEAGHIRVLNESEQSFDDFCEAEDQKRSASGTT
jgi:hypothetical protein